mgnify:CR=1 FL=1
MGKESLTLALLPSGCKARVREIVGGYGLRGRLLELGFVKGTNLRVLKNDRGPLIISIDGVRLALGRGVANKILVEPIEGVG